jgi:hypothetical protein
MHGLIALFPGVIALAIILFVVGLGALQVLVTASRAIVALIILVMIVRSAIIAVRSVDPMVIGIFTTTMLPVSQFTAMHGRKMSHFLFLWLLLVLGNLLKNASCLVGCLTLLKERDYLEWVSRHRLVHVCKLVLVCLGLREEDLLTLLLRRGYFHHSTEVATLEVVEKLHLTPRELVHQHECRLLGRTKPANQLVVYIWETGNNLKVIPDALVKVCLCTICIVWALLCNDAGPLGQAYVLKALTHVAQQQWTITFCVSKSQVKIFDLKLGSVYTRKYSAPN